MRRIFGAKRDKAPAPTLTDVTTNMESRGGNLDERIKKLDAELVKHREAIKKLRPGPAQEAAKQRALRVLRQKKMYEGQRGQLYDQQFNIEQVAFAQESMKDTADQVKAMRGATAHLKQAFKSKDLDVDKIEAMQDEMADLMDMNTEIQESLARQYAVPDDLDEEVKQRHMHAHTSTHEQLMLESRALIGK
uniref:Charged multivesicular body protein 5 n=1 Tax=Pyramimonas obovata TaxID=1411642 RepID=A0A6T7UQX8_9CHLO|mmetsp:Transcript_14897/g.31997  ORF Transcript_14897/g.31997 Transcript_14897/m.31997 type:complete len:191 (+) Transcript_14897:316-888(+)